MNLLAILWWIVFISLIILLVWTRNHYHKKIMRLLALKPLMPKLEEIREQASTRIPKIKEFVDAKLKQIMAGDKMEFPYSVELGSLETAMDFSDTKIMGSTHNSEEQEFDEFIDYWCK